MIYLLFLKEIFALSYIPAEQIGSFKNVNQTKSSFLLKHSRQMIPSLELALKYSSTVNWFNHFGKLFGIVMV